MGTVPGAGRRAPAASREAWLPVADQAVRFVLNYLPPSERFIPTLSTVDRCVNSCI